MSKTLVAALSALMLASAGAAAAQPPAPGAWDLGRREGWLQDRIAKGRTDGSLTRMEAHRVERQLSRIRYDERRMRRHDGGVLRDGQRTMLQRRLDTLADHIRWARHNDVTRPWA